MVSVLGDEAVAQRIKSSLNCLTAIIRSGIRKVQNTHESSHGQRPVKDIRRSIGAWIGGESLTEPDFAKRRPLVARHAHSLGIESALNGGRNIRWSRANSFSFVIGLAEGSHDRAKLNRQNQSQNPVRFH